MSINQTQNKSTFLSDFFIGGITGSIGKTIFAPFDRIKLILQTQDSNTKLTGKKYTGITNCVKRVYFEEGLAAFWKGNFPNILHYFPTAAFNFAFKDSFQQILKVDQQRPHPFKFLLLNILAGGLAGATCNALIFPLKLARLCLGVDVGSSESKQFKSLAHFFVTVYQRSGIRGIYSGLCNSLVSVFIFRGVHFGLFDTGKTWITDFDKRSILQKLIFAQFVTILAETATYPSDTLKRRMMMNGFQKEKIFSNSYECARVILKQEGVRGFYKGNLSNILKSGSSSLMLVLFDSFKLKWDKFR